MMCVSGTPHFLSNMQSEFDIITGHHVEQYAGKYGNMQSEFDIITGHHVEQYAGKYGKVEKNMNMILKANNLQQWRMAWRNKPVKQHSIVQ